MLLSASITLMFTELPLLERFAAARAAGFDGVEIQRLDEGDAGQMARAAQAAGVEVALVNVPSGDWMAGGNGLSGVPGREDAFREAFERALDAALILGAGRLHLGPARVPAGVDRETCMSCLLANAETALDIAAGSPLTLLVEAMNRVDAPTALLGDLETAAAVVNRVGNDRLGLQFDVYHAAMNGEDPAAAFLRHRALVRHVQFADVPGRHEPGTGRLDIPAILGMIARAGHAGWFGAEYMPRTTTMEGLGWLGALQASSSA